MGTDTYHHQMLKEEMIEKGLLLLNQEGYEKFSLRRVAAACGVSHAAPYKHFKNKDELVDAIKNEVVENFKRTLEAAAVDFPKDPKTQIVALGKQYVKFMVENPEYLKFLFFSTKFDSPVIIQGPEVRHDDNGTFNVFTKSAVKYLEFLNAPPENRITDILTMWSTVHGIAVLIVNQNIIYSGDYLDLVEKILSDKLRFD